MYGEHLELYKYYPPDKKRKLFISGLGITINYCVEMHFKLWSRNNFNVSPVGFTFQKQSGMPVTPKH